jgi:hypothetical protein
MAESFTSDAPVGPQGLIAWLGWTKWTNYG